jgi:PEP-CTERM motif
MTIAHKAVVGIFRFCGRIVMKKLLLAAAAIVALGAAGQAQATCVSSTPISAPDPGAGTTCSITADASTVDIVFAYKSAADVDLLLNGVSLLISNQDTLGTEATLTGLTVGQVLDFVFTNQTTGDSFQAGVAASDGDQHIAVQSTYADFQTDPPRTYLTQAELGAAYGVMTGIAPIGDWTFAGMEDLLANQNSDFDYNDLIFGFLGIAPPLDPVPEPMTLSLLGVGLAGLAAIRRRRAA